MCVWGGIVGQYPLLWRPTAEIGEAGDIVSICPPHPYLHPRGPLGDAGWGEASGPEAGGPLALRSEGRETHCRRRRRLTSGVTQQDHHNLGATLYIQLSSKL